MTAAALRQKRSSLHAKLSEFARYSDTAASWIGIFQCAALQGQGVPIDIDERAAFTVAGEGVASAVQGNITSGVRKQGHSIRELYVVQ